MSSNFGKTLGIFRTIIERADIPNDVNDEGERDSDDDDDGGDDNYP